MRLTPRRGEGLSVDDMETLLSLAAVNLRCSKSLFLRPEVFGLVGDLERSFTVKLFECVLECKVKAPPERIFGELLIALVAENFDGGID